MKTVKLSTCTVEIVEKITWGIQEEIRSAMLGGIRVSGLTDKDRQNLELDSSVLGKAKYKALELCIKKITDAEGKESTYTKEWMDNLSVEDGDALFAAVNEVTDPKKK